MQNIYDNAYLTIRPIFGREIAVQVVPQPACDRLLEQQIKARLRLRKSPAAWRKNLALRLFYVSREGGGA